MNFLDDLDIKYEYLNQELELIKPNLTQSVAGILPTLIKHLDVPELPSSLNLDDLAKNPSLDKKIQESFPSGYKNIILLTCDGVGVNRLADIGGTLWENITSQGSIAYSMYPTMTSVNMTSLSFGMYPADHGLIGYNIYNEHIDTIWNSLNLKYLNGGAEKSILDRSLSEFVAGDPIVDKIYKDVPTTFLSPVQLESPGLADIIIHSAPRTEYEDPMDAGLKLGAALNQSLPNQIISLYIGYADHFGHHMGPMSMEYEQAIKGINHSLDLVTQNPKITSGDTIVVVTADHGQVQLDHSISNWMTRNEVADLAKQGIQLSTSGRSIHAYCRQEKLDRTRAFLENMAGDRGTIITKEQAIAFAGGNLKFEKRFSDLTLLFADNYIYDVPEVVQLGEEGRLLGQHGSLTAKELFVPVGIFGGNG